MTNFDNGFSAKKQQAVTSKIGKQYQKKTKVVKTHGIQEKDQRSSNEYNTRVYKETPKKAMAMTYGATNKAGKGTTVYKKGKK